LLEFDCLDPVVNEWLRLELAAPDASLCLFGCCSGDRLLAFAATESTTIDLPWQQRVRCLSVVMIGAHRGSLLVHGTPAGAIYRLLLQAITSAARDAEVSLLIARPFGSHMNRRPVGWTQIPGGYVVRDVDAWWTAVAPSPVISDAVDAAVALEPTTQLTADSSGHVYYVVNVALIGSGRAVAAASALCALIREDAPEADFQALFELYPELIANERYRAVWPQLTLERTDGRGQTLRPDFILQPFDTDGLCDLLEIKRPSAPLSVSTRHGGRPSAELMDGVAQLHRYRIQLEDSAARFAFESRTGLHLYRPRLRLVMGISASVLWHSPCVSVYRSSSTLLRAANCDHAGTSSP
jgi:hypothetical protein